MNKSRAPQPAQPDIPAARIGAWELLRGAKHSLALLKPGTVLGNWLQAQLRRRQPGATGTRGKECLKERGQVLLTPPELLAPDIPDAPVEPGSSAKLPLLAAPPPGAAGVPPSSPTLLFRRWVRKVESLISQPMTSGKNELQDHLIFISEKALHKRNRIVWSKGYSTAEQKDLVMQKKNKQ
ncbi:uncharacterized protein Gm38418 isoform X2 [Mus musculus]|uniref:uncharacterized protein Gm38418 isoform X2 n=1 Tax=Mus musculus TaxID=10090 RepID=UPI0016786095|nr:uncharacterized protein Gm38418 isoform X2 [Mus musculus]